MLFRSKSERRYKNNKSGSTEGQGVARSTKTGGFEVHQDLDMICDDSSVESDSLPTNPNVTIFDTNESRSSVTKSTTTTVSTPRKHRNASPSASVSQNSRDDCSWARQDDDRINGRTSVASLRRQRRDENYSTSNSVATPQPQGCCSFPILGRDNWQPERSFQISVSSIEKNDTGSLHDGRLVHTSISSPSQPTTPTFVKKVTPTTVNLAERAIGPIDLDDDDLSYSSSIDSDLGGRIIISDSKLMEAGSPGSLRLTPDALQRHHRRAVLTAAKPPQRSTPPAKGYESWKSRRDEQQWFKEQHQARDEELIDQTWKSQRQQRERAPTSTTIGSSEGSCSGRPHLASDTRKWSLGEMSQNSWSSHLLGEDLEDEEDEEEPTTPNRSNKRLVVCKSGPLQTISQSSIATSRLHDGDDQRSRGKASLASDVSRQSTAVGGSNGSRCIVSTSSVQRPRKVLTQEPAVPGPKTKTVDVGTAKTAKKNHKILPHRGLRALFAAEEDVADLSLAPLNCFEDLPVPPSPAKPQRQHVGKNPLLGVFRQLVPHNIVSVCHKKSTAQMAADLLEKERQRELQSRLAQRREEEEERERIQQLKTAELERQRKLEAEARMERKRQKRVVTPRTTITGQQSSNKLAVKQLMIFPDNHVDHTGQDVSTITTATSSMAPCVMCRSGQRTHIAMPCMHYTFCEACVNMMRVKKINRCPVCATPNVVFSHVLT